MAQLYLFELFIDTINFIPMVSYIPDKKNLKVMVKFDNLVNMDIEAKEIVIIETMLQSSKEIIYFQFGKTFLFLSKPADLLEAIRVSSIEIRLKSNGSKFPFAYAYIPWEIDFINSVKATLKNADNLIPATVENEYELINDNDGIIGNINLSLKLWCFGRNIQTYFQIQHRKPITELVPEKRYLFKNCNTRSTFIAQKYCKHIDREKTPVKCPFCNCTTMHKKGHLQVSDMTTKQLNKVLCKNKICRGIKKFSEYGLKMEAMDHIPLHDSNNHIPLLHGLPHVYKNFERYGPNIPFIKPMSLEHFNPDSKRINSSECGESSRISCNEQCKKEESCNCSDLLRLRGGAPGVDEDREIAPMAMCKDLMKSYDKVLNEYKKALGPCGKGICPFAVNVIEETCRKFCHFPSESCEEEHDLQMTPASFMAECTTKPDANALSACGTPTCPYSRNANIDADKSFQNNQIRSACGSPTCKFTKQKIGTATDDDMLELQFMDGACKPQPCGSTKYPVSPKPDLPPIHWDCPDPLPKGPCRNPQCPLKPPELRYIARGPCGSTKCPLAGPPYCGAPNCPFGPPPPCPYAQPSCPPVPSISEDPANCGDPNCPGMGVSENNAPKCPPPSCPPPSCPPPSCPPQSCPLPSCPPPPCPPPPCPSPSHPPPCFPPPCFPPPFCPSPRCPPTGCGNPLCPSSPPTCGDPFCPLNPIPRPCPGLCPPRGPPPCPPPPCPPPPPPPSFPCDNPTCPFAQTNKSMMSPVESINEIGVLCDNPVCPFQSKAKDTISLNGSICSNPECPFAKNGKNGNGGEKDKIECSFPNCPFATKISIKSNGSVCDNPECPFATKASIKSSDSICDNPDCPFAAKTNTKPNENICDNPECPFAPKASIKSNESICDNPDCPFATKPSTKPNGNVCDNPECPFAVKPSPKTDEKVCENPNCPFAENKQSPPPAPIPQTDSICSNPDCHFVIPPLESPAKRASRRISATAEPDTKINVAPDGDQGSRKVSLVPVNGNGKKKKRAKYAFKVGDLYPGIYVGHKQCNIPGRNVPAKMGWLWNVHIPCLSLKPRLGWRPGAVSRTVANKIYAHRKAKGLKMLESLEAAKPGKKKRKQGEYESDSDVTVAPKSTLQIKKKDGVYTITMNPLKDPKTIEDNENPYMDCTPLQFKITKNKPAEDGNKLCFCDVEEEEESSESELDIEFTPPAGIIRPERLKKKKDVVHTDTQYAFEDFSDSIPKPAGKPKKGKGKGKKK